MSDFWSNALRAMSDDAGASVTEGQTFALVDRRRRGLFGLSDDPPAVLGASLTEAHVRARRRWRTGAVGVQVSWSHHGRVRVLRLDDGTEVAAWTDETHPVRRGAGAGTDA